MAEIKITVDEKYGMGYIYLQNRIADESGSITKKFGRSVEVYLSSLSPKKTMPDLIIDLDSDGKIMGIEIFNSYKLLAQELIDGAEKLK